MMLGTILGWMIAGLIVGGISRLLMPGRQNMGAGMTMILGITGAMLGGFIASLLFGPSLVTDGEQVYSVYTAWPGWLMSILGGMIVLWIAIAAAGPRARSI